MTTLSIEDYADLAEDFEAYAEACLVIRPKEGDPIAFQLNRAQRWLHSRGEAQLAATGRVRIIGLKGRQQGFSTYVEGRAYWKTTHRRGYRAFILTNKDDATENIFGMAKRFHEHCPDDLRPATGAANANELAFPGLDSGYKVATAGGKASGRSHTVQFFHGSEVAFWPNAQEHARGALQTVPPKAGEVWLESTSDGPGNFFHQMCLDAIAGKSGYEFVFVPWFWQEEYRSDASNFTTTAEEQEMLALYGGAQPDGGPGMSVENLVWRRQKMFELGGEEAFKREYPNSIEEAFEVATHDKLIDPAHVRAARNRDVRATAVLPIWGVDAARFGDDESTLCKRQGNVVLEAVKHWQGLDTMKVAGAIVTEYRATPEEDRPSDIVVDSIGIGAGVADRLREVFADEGWTETEIVDVNVAEAASESDLHNRLRDELWWRGREWLEPARASKLPDDDEQLAQDLCAPMFWHTSSGKRQVEPKDKFKKRLKRSSDRGDAFCNTFYVAPKPRSRRKEKSPASFSWSDF